jgi:hypothetical protein
MIAMHRRSLLTLLGNLGREPGRWRRGAAGRAWVAEC